ncbi:MAG: hypothetical protein HPAVJP_2750 [Candidatus Hepatoplasma vulgare]|nr:MAG: hypothetical protein HPAVJP_2750 [Candidatus Hepatoplasma sp.]
MNNSSREFPILFEAWIVPAAIEKVTPKNIIKRMEENKLLKVELNEDLKSLLDVLK